MPRVLNKYKDVVSKDDVYIGRPSVWGNPFQIGRDGTREEVIEKYRNFLSKQKSLAAAARKELRGKNLVCFCAPKACHGDILLKIANED